MKVSAKKAIIIIMTVGIVIISFSLGVKKNMTMKVSEFDSTKVAASMIGVSNIKRS